jgi:hypothetical protein
VTIDRLRQIERAEDALRVLGVTGDVRVRYHGDLARVELGPEALTASLMPDACLAIYTALRDVGFDRVALDLRGFRSGSLNVLGGVVAEPLVRARSTSGGGDGAGLAAAFARLGFHCDIESRDRLAIVRCAGAGAVEELATPGWRSAVVDTARGQGFTHVAVDLEAVVADAPVRRG